MLRRQTATTGQDPDSKVRNQRGVDSRMARALKRADWPAEPADLKVG